MLQERFIAGESAVDQEILRELAELFEADDPREPMRKSWDVGPWGRDRAVVRLEVKTVEGVQKREVRLELQGYLGTSLAAARANHRIHREALEFTERVLTLVGQLGM